MGVRLLANITQGVDEFRQGQASTAFPGALGMNIGLRVPQFIPQSGFLFLTNTITVPPSGLKIISLKRMVMIGFTCQSAGGQLLLIEQKVTTPGFQWPDGAVCWHIVLQRNVRRRIRQELTDAQNFCAIEADGPALLYQPGSVSYSPNFADPVTGAPLVYPSGMTSYNMPLNLQREWIDVAGLKTIMDSTDAIEPVDCEIPFDVRNPMRLAVYCWVDQTNPFARPAPTNQSNLPPEWQFAQNHGFDAQNNVSGVFTSRVGALLSVDLNYPMSEPLTGAEQRDLARQEGKLPGIGGRVSRERRAA